MTRYDRRDVLKLGFAAAIGAADRQKDCLGTRAARCGPHSADTRPRHRLRRNRRRARFPRHPAARIPGRCPRVRRGCGPAREAGLSSHRPVSARLRTDAVPRRVSAADGGTGGHRSGRDRSGGRLEDSTFRGRRLRLGRARRRHRRRAQSGSRPRRGADWRLHHSGRVRHTGACDAGARTRALVSGPTSTPSAAVSASRRIVERSAGSCGRPGRRPGSSRPRPTNGRPHRSTTPIS